MEMADNVMEAKYPIVVNVKPHQAYCLMLLLTLTDRCDTHVAFVVIPNYEFLMQNNSRSYVPT